LVSSCFTQMSVTGYSESRYAVVPTMAFVR
jgi:hypothetical protein